MTPSKLKAEFGKPVPAVNDLLDEESALYTTYRQLTPEDPAIPEWWPKSAHGRVPGESRRVRIFVEDDTLPFAFFVETAEATDEVIAGVADLFGGMK